MPSAHRHSLAAVDGLLAAVGLSLCLAGCSPGSVSLDTASLDLDDHGWAWGDLHAHSGWSFDGCENPDVDCSHHPDGPGADFFASAAQVGLDFAALTDHAEAGLYRYGPDALHDSGAELDIWSGQQDLAVLADGGPVLPLLGYEWTAFRDADNQDGPGSHRTVILGDTRACEAYRVPGKDLSDGEFVPQVGDRAFEQGSRPAEPTPAGLWLALSRAALTPGCDPVRWVSFAHHSAYLVPQVTDWAVDDNAPIAEHIVEIYSEHGSSECRDLSLAGCDWAVNEVQGYLPTGSVQAALDRGYHLGFVAGTDSHDARPGSLEDGPSHVAHWPEGDSGPPQVQFAPGGLTGVLVPQPFDRDALLDGLEAARTVATSGPRPDLLVKATGQDGTVYLPGAVIPRWNLPAGIVLSLGELDPRGSLTWDQVDDVIIERIGDGGRLLSSASGEAFGDAWAPGSDEHWTYLRVRLLRAGEADPDDPLAGEERIWVSPWFTEERSGCSTGGGIGGWLGALLAALLAALRCQITKRMSATPSQARASRAGPAQARRGCAGDRATTQASRISRKGS